MNNLRISKCSNVFLDLSISDVKSLTLTIRNGQLSVVADCKKYAYTVLGDEYPLPGIKVYDYVPAKGPFKVNLLSSDYRASFKSESNQNFVIRIFKGKNKKPEVFYATKFIALSPVKDDDGNRLFGLEFQGLEKTEYPHIYLNGSFRVKIEKKHN